MLGAEQLPASYKPQQFVLRKEPAELPFIRGQMVVTREHPTSASSPS
jgi:hypothetical protein